MQRRGSPRVRFSMPSSRPSTERQARKSAARWASVRRRCYLWKKKYGGMGADELRRLKQLESENRKLKQMVADLSLDKHMLQDVLSKKV